MTDLAVKLRLVAEDKGLKSTVEASRKELEQLDDELNHVEREMEEGAQASKQYDRNLSGVGSSLKKIGGALLGGIAVQQTVSGLIGINKEFQGLDAQLKTATGSAAAAEQALGWLEQFGATTPFQLNEVTQAFVQLQNLGLTPSEDSLRSYGNTAAAMGKSLDQMIEAVADAATGEFERLKEFGIKAKSEGDNVKFTFQGVETEVQKNSRAIEGYLLSLGKTKFADGMDNQMKTLEGAFSNLGDATDRLARKVGEKSGLNAGLIALASGITGIINAATGAPQPLDELAARLDKLESRSSNKRRGGGTQAAISNVQEEIQQALEAKSGESGIRAQLSRIDGQIADIEQRRVELQQTIDGFNGDRAESKGSGRNKTQTAFGALVQEQRQINGDLEQITAERDKLFKRLSDVSLTFDEGDVPAKPYDDLADSIKEASKASKELEKSQKSLKDLLGKEFDLKPLKEKEASNDPASRLLQGRIDGRTSIEVGKDIGRGSRALSAGDIGEAKAYYEEAYEAVKQLQESGSEAADDFISGLKELDDEIKKHAENVAGVKLESDSPEAQGERVDALLKSILDSKSVVQEAMNEVFAVDQSNLPESLTEMINTAVKDLGHLESIPLQVDKTNLESTVDAAVSAVEQKLKNVSIEIPVKASLQGSTGSSSGDQIVNAAIAGGSF